jgi:hypothetical protein
MWLCGFIEKLEFLPACDRQASLLISNAELQSKNAELGIRFLTQMVLQEDLGTWYLALCTKYHVQKKGLLERAALCNKADSINSRTHRKSSSHSTYVVL